MITRSLREEQDFFHECQRASSAKFPRRAQGRTDMKTDSTDASCFPSLPPLSSTVTVIVGRAYWQRRCGSRFTRILHETIAYFIFKDDRRHRNKTRGKTRMIGRSRPIVVLGENHPPIQSADQR